MVEYNGWILHEKVWQLSWSRVLQEEREDGTLDQNHEHRAQGQQSQQTEVVGRVDFKCTAEGKREVWDDPKARTAVWMA